MAKSAINTHTEAISMLIRKLILAPVNMHISNTLFRHLVVTNSRFVATLLTSACAAGLSFLLVLSMWKDAYRLLKHDLREYSPVIGSFSVPPSWLSSTLAHERRSLVDFRSESPVNPGWE